MKAEKTILEEQSEIEAALDHLPALAAQLPAALKALVRLSPRKGFRVQVSLRRGNAKDSRQVKQNAPARSWLPDSGLVAIMYRSAIPDESERVLVNAIDRNWILTSRVANPKNPQFPVTAIKVNRPLSEVHSILEQEPGPRSGFNPVAMRGEPLSQTVLRERR